MQKYIDKYKNLPAAVKASFWFLICSFMQKGISVLTTPIFTRLLSTSDYGQYTVFYSWLDLCSIFVTLRLYYGVFVQGLVKYDDEKKVFASSMQGLELTLCSIWTIIYICGRDFWNGITGLTTVQMLSMLVSIWATGAARFWAAEQRNEFKYRALVIVTLLTSVLKPVLGIILVLRAEDKATARIVGLVLVEFMVYVWLFFIQLVRGKTFYSKKYWKHSLLFAIPLLPHYLSQSVLNVADRIMIREMIGLSEAGIYGLAYSISKIMIIFNTALHQTMDPWIYKKIKANRAPEIVNVAYPSLVGVAIINIVLIAFAPELVHIFAPKAYYDAIWVIPPVAMSVYFSFGYNLFSSFEFYFEKKKFILVGSIISAVLNIVLNFIFLQLFGYYAAAYTTLICYMVYTIGHYLFMLKICKENMKGVKVYNTKTILLITGSFMAVGFVMLFTYKYLIIRYSIITLLFILAFAYRETIISHAREIISLRKRKSEQH